MPSPARSALLLLALIPAAVILAGDRDDRSREAKKQREKIEDLADKLARRLALPAPSPESVFLHARAAELLERVRQSTADGYRFQRLASATDALLEASERIFDSGKKKDGRERDAQRETALALERYYFRAQQADYFAASARESAGGAYVSHARSLYQQARSAYDAREHNRAKKLGEASALIVRALESLAQAAVRIPEPPRLR